MGIYSWTNSLSLSDDELRYIEDIGDTRIAKIKNANLNAPDLEAYQDDQTWFHETGETLERF